MIDRILDFLFGKKVIVNCDRDPYLIRWYVIRTAKFAIFIHKFIRSDEDRALHDHPWNFIVIPIWRGYFEHAPCEHCARVGEPEGTLKRRVYPIIGTRVRSATFRHRVELMPCDDTTVCTFFQDPNEFDIDDDCPKCGGRGTMPSWSIFIRFKEFREWGFWPAEGFQKWNDWWREKCE